MKKLITLFFISLIISPLSQARNDVGDYPIADTNFESVTTGGVSFYFGDQKHGKIIKTHGKYPTNKKTNAFNKSDSQACNWAFLSALKSLNTRAKKEGGNAVVDIRSNYKGDNTSSATTFKCGAGTFVAGVALIGTVVTLAK